MDDTRRAELAARLWIETTVEELFGLDEVDRQVVELRVRLVGEVRRRRERAGMVPTLPAARTEGGQSVASLDQLVDTFHATGVSLAELGEVIARS